MSRDIRALIPPHRVLKPESLAISEHFDLYFSTLRPSPSCILRFLFPLDISFADVTIFRPVGRGDKRLATYDAMLYIVLMEQRGLQVFSFLIPQEDTTKEFAADRIGNALRADNFLSII